MSPIQPHPKLSGEGLQLWQCYGTNIAWILIVLLIKSTANTLNEKQQLLRCGWSVWTVSVFSGLKIYIHEETNYSSLLLCLLQHSKCSFVHCLSMSTVSLYNRGGERVELNWSVHSRQEQRWERVCSIILTELLKVIDQEHPVFWDKPNQHGKKHNTAVARLTDHLVVTEHSSKQYWIIHLSMQLVIQ